MKRTFTKQNRESLWLTRSAVIAALLLINLSFVTINAQQQYTLTDDDVVVTDGVIQSCSYSFEIKDIIIPDTLDGQAVTGIVDKEYSYGVFSGKGIVSAQLPSTLEFIGDDAFEENQLEIVTIPSNVTTIGWGAFANNQLTNVSIPNSVTTIEYGAFANNQLTNVTIPNSVTTIGKYAFYGNQLTSIALPDPVIKEDCSFTEWVNGDDGVVTEITDFASSYMAQFVHILTDDDVVVTDGVLKSCSYNFDIKDIVIPDTLDGQAVTAIWSYVFFYKQLKSVTIPNSVITIENSAFENNELTDVTIPNSVTTISEWAFSDNQLTSVTIPNSVTTIGGGAFNNNSITEINGEASNGIIYNRNSDGSEDSTKIVSYGGMADDIDFIPNGVATIGWGAFYGNQLISVSIPNSVTTIGNYAFSSNQLSSVTIPNSVTTIYEWAFAHNQLTSITIPNSVTTIGVYAFYDNQLTSIALPDPVIKEGYTFTEWINGDSATVTEITDFDNSYEAQFDFTGVMVSGALTAGDAVGLAAKGLKSVTINDMSDVVLELSGDITGTRPVNADGTYSFALNLGRTITITPVKEGYRFEPASIELSNVQADVEEQDFTPVEVATIVSSPGAANVKAYPNPVMAMLTIETGGAYNVLQVVNLTGTVVKTIDCENQTQLQVDMTVLSRGVYFIKLADTEQKYSPVIMKVVKK